jgi:uncharacterized protein involved in outer membrane biogenesis
MKTALKIIGGIFALILILIIAIPMFVDVDKFRPQIVKTANEKINGTLELGHLKLSLWGRVSVNVDGMKLIDARSKPVVSVKDVSFDIPFMSVLSGAPLITLSMNNPELSVLKTRDGKLNVMSLMKAGATTTPVGNSTTTTTTSKTEKVELPSMVANARFGVSIKEAKLSYIDETMGLTNTVDHLNVLVKDFSLNHKTEMQVWADLKTQMADLKLDGPIKLIAELDPEVSGGEFKSASVDATFTADDLEIEKGQLFHKKKGVAANFKFKGSMTQDSLKIENASAKFFNAEVVVKGNYGKETGANIDFSANPVDLKPWSALVPMLKEYELEGKLTLGGDVKGKPEALEYSAKLGVQNLSMKGPNLKAKPVINAEIVVATDRIEKIYADLKGPGNELFINGKMNSFKHPQLTFDVKSPKGLDLDQWIEFPKTEKTAAKGESAKGEASTGKGAPASDLDAMVDPLRKNEMAKETVVDGTVEIAFIKAKGIRIDAISTKIQMKNLVAGISNLKMRMYDGAIGANFSTDLKPRMPQYTMGLKVDGIDLAKAVESQFTSMKNTIVGKMSMNATGGGSSFNTEPAKRNLKMKGDFKVVNAQFKTLDVAKMANDALAGSLGKIAGKVPFLAGKKLNVNENGASRYEYISSTFTISDGVLNAPNFVAKAVPKFGIDISGTTKMGLVDESLDGKWELKDTYQVTDAHNINVAIAGKQINNVLAKSEKDPVIFPITVGCKWSAPCPNYNSSAEYLAGVAAGRLKNVATDVVKEKATGAVKDAAVNQFKKLFGH